MVFFSNRIHWCFFNLMRNIWIPFLILWEMWIKMYLEMLVFFQVFIVSVTVLLLFCVLVFWPEACGILAPWSGIELLPAAVEAWSLNHWTAGEVPTAILLKIVFCPLVSCFTSKTFIISPLSTIGALWVLVFQGFSHSLEANVCFYFLVIHRRKYLSVGAGGIKAATKALE